MRILFQVLFTLFILTSCSEKFDTLDPSEFNDQIADRTDIETGEELIRIYYNYPEEEGIPQLTFNERETGKGIKEVTLIHDYMEDDSQRAVKIVMTAERENKIWVVKEIKTNRKCWDGRGHTNWGTEWCL